ncbi:uncharacterized protein [Montipora foliosa]|uniref:uncharacterized protein n=1 Tax=Montipora foliosa TaxID=591990 RepID=UPI0035F19AF9
MFVNTLTLVSFLLSFIFYPSNGKTAEEWKGRIIYQLLTDRFAPSGEIPSQKCSNLKDYCGGTFKGIEKNLDYITGLGVNAIWISPIVQNTDKGYHGYWAQDIFKINPHFGTKEDLISLVKACHERDVWVMADLVANHMGYPPNFPGNLKRNFNNFVPFNDAKYFHPYHSYIKWPEECKDQWKIENYWLANLPDLNQSHPFVHRTLLDWIRNMTDQFDFDGYRLDTAIQVPKDFWAEFRKSGGVFMVGEANNGPPPCGSMEYVAEYQGYIDSVLAYPMYWTLREVFQEKSKDFTSLSTSVKRSYEIYKDRSIFGGFVDNHDNPRFLNVNPSYTALKNGLTYVIMGDWIPIVYYGTEQGFNGGSDPNNRESLWPDMSTEHPLYRFIQSLVKFRLSLDKEWLQQKQVEMHVQSDAYAFSRGQIMIVVTSRDETIDLTIEKSPYKTGDILRNALNPKETFTVSSGGSLPVTLNSGEPLVLQKEVSQ